jgi:hypothetical protein
MNPQVPTQSMVAYFLRKLKRHRSRVANNVLKVLPHTKYQEELIFRAKSHDLTKLNEDEFISYVWLNEYRRCKEKNISFKYPVGVHDIILDGTKSHINKNKHHPEHHADPNAMSEVDILEMVCDWSAISQENNENNGSARKWAESALTKIYKFDNSRSAIIYNTIEIIDSYLKSENIDKNCIPH